MATDILREQIVELFRRLSNLETGLVVERDAARAVNDLLKKALLDIRDSDVPSSASELRTIARLALADLLTGR